MSEHDAQPPADAPEPRQVSPRPDPFAANAEGALIRSVLTRMNDPDEHQAGFRAGLAALRQRAEQVVGELQRAQKASDPDDYQLRWALVYTAAKLEHPAALSMLKDLVLTPIPPERSPVPESFSTVAEETILRTTAVEGVERLVRAGDSNALDALFEFLGQPSLSIRRAAVQAILATPQGPQLRERIAALLPPDQQFLLDLKGLKVDELPQIDEAQRAVRVITPETPLEGPARDDTPRIS